MMIDVSTRVYGQRQTILLPLDVLALMLGTLWVMETKEGLPSYLEPHTSSQFPSANHTGHQHDAWEPKSSDFKPFSTPKKRTHS